MIAEGSSNAQIARALGLSLKTVQNYVFRVLDKLQVTDRTQAAIRAHEGRLDLLAAEVRRKRQTQEPRVAGRCLPCYRAEDRGFEPRPSRSAG